MDDLTKREEAIEVLKREKLSLDEKYYKAIEMAIEALEQEPVKTLKQIPKACKNCSNHPSNGGSGVCFCTLGSMTITC